MIYMQANMKKKTQSSQKLTKGEQEHVIKQRSTPVDASVSHMKCLYSKYEANRLELESLRAEMTDWLLDHQQQVDELFGHSDTDRPVSLKDFELALRSEDVSWLDRRPHQLLRYRFVRLRVRLIPFDYAAAHPGNFEVVLLSSSRVFSLIRMIQDQVRIQTSRLEVFQTKVPTEEARLPPESSLEECGFKGEPEETPPEDTVYYDYRPLFTDCPILNCDHYFRSTSDSAAIRTGRRP